MSFIKELKDRHVFKVATAYVFMAWLVMQVADVILGNIDAPEWVFRVLLLFLAVGFPFAVFFAWAYDLTPEGVKAAPRQDGTTATKNKTPVLLIGLIVIIGLSAGGWWFSGKDLRWVRDEAMPEIEALVESGDPETAYALAAQVEVKFPGHPGMADIWSSFSWTTSIL